MRSDGRLDDGALFNASAKASAIDTGTEPIKSASIFRFVDGEILLKI